MSTPLPPPARRTAPPSKRSVERVLKVDGHTFVQPSEAPNLTMRYTESFIRRRLMTLEDESIVGLYERARAVYRHLRNGLADMMDANGQRRFEPTPDTRELVRQFNAFTAATLTAYAREQARYTYNRAVLIYMAAYYGRLWQLTSIAPTAPIEFTPLDRRTASRAVLALAEASADWLPGDDTIYNLLGQEWLELFADETDMLVVGIRQDIRRVMNERGSREDASQAIADGLGVRLERAGRTVPPIKLTGNVHRLNVIARSYMIEAMNRATVATYEDNADLIWGVRFLTSADGRVCPICTKLLGQQWELGSPDIQMPVTDTHPQCRCTLLPVMKRDIELVADDAPPQETFANWLTRVGADDLIDRFARVPPAS